MKCPGGLDKDTLDDTVGIHPTCAEDLTAVTEIKKEGEMLEAGGNC